MTADLTIDGQALTERDKRVGVSVGAAVIAMFAGGTAEYQSYIEVLAESLGLPGGRPAPVDHVDFCSELVRRMGG